MTCGPPQNAAPRGGPPAGPLLLGVRHHGPGSARAVRAALEAYEPRVVLIEGPPEGDAVVGLAGEEAMVPPVALLAHAVNEPGRAAFWPLAEFSPEWVAIRWAVRRGVPVRFIDLPAAHTLAMSEGRTVSEGEEQLHGEGGEKPHKEGDGTVPGGPHGGGAAGDTPPDGLQRPAGQKIRLDPLAALAEVAGYDDPERWWEDAVEHRRGGRHDPFAPFTALGEAMSELRAVHGDGGHGHDLLREAHMRLRLREAAKEFGSAATAVVCGAWHVPALAEPEQPAVTADRRMLKGLPRVKAEVTWVPWTYRRLARRSGYGAGIAAPGWYGHLFAVPDRPVERWMTKVAGLLRERDHPVSSAHVIEAVRLAETLAALRARPLAGLTECTDAIRAVLCEGSDVPLALIRERLVVGEALGEVPEGAPAVPLQRDVERCGRAVRLKPAATEREMDLDLRKDTDAARSRLLHRLRLLGVDWGVPAHSRAGSTGTFRETWRLRWEPELSVRVAEAALWGTTVYEAATVKACSRAVEAPGGTLADVTALAEHCLLAHLPDALPVVMRVLSDRAALEADVGHLAQALPALVRSLRYGDVRGTDAGALAEVAGGMAARVCVGLPPACAGLGDEGAREMRGPLDAAHQAVRLLTRGEPCKEGEEGLAGEGQAEEGRSGAGLLSRWRGMLRTLAGRALVPGLLRGRCVRLLLDEGSLADEEAERLMRLALSPGTPPGEAAAWVEGFLSGGGMLLVHDERLLALVDRWLTGVPAEAFTHVLPLLRRTFAQFESGVRRTLGELARRGPAGEGAGAAAGAGEGLPGFGPGLEAARAEPALETVRLLLGGARAGAAASREDGSGPVDERQEVRA
ncbi:hypothetical protein DQ392_11375 [Streptomyces reniochalinae]|uniref:Uncharacterized protein n=1 Tax=Streptomyces reniochalinae TaxID=2250578 RepID=A0A367EMX3_9ACTN|nr:hypothetical protein DQ392_11375 [Streptomyces reniochalinae]